jgi:hypothetical protein
MSLQQWQPSQGDIVIERPATCPSFSCDEGHAQYRPLYKWFRAYSICCRVSYHGDRSSPLKLSRQQIQMILASIDQNSVQVQTIRNQPLAISIGAVCESHEKTQYNKKTARVCFWSENIKRVLFLAGKGTRPQVECLSQAKKSTSVITLQKHRSAVFCLSHATICLEMVILPRSAARQITAIASWDAFAVHRSSLGLTTWCHLL